MHQPVVGHLTLGGVGGEGGGVGGEIKNTHFLMSISNDPCTITNILSYYGVFSEKDIIDNNYNNCQQIYTNLFF